MTTITSLLADIEKRADVLAHSAATKGHTKAGRDALKVAERVLRKILTDYAESK